MAHVDRFFGLQCCVTGTARTGFSRGPPQHFWAQSGHVIAAIFLVIPKVRDSKWKPVNHRSASLSQGKDALPFHARGCLFPLSSPLLGKGEGTLVIHCFDEQIKLGAK